MVDVIQVFVDSSYKSSQIVPLIGTCLVQVGIALSSLTQLNAEWTIVKKTSAFQQCFQGRDLVTGLELDIVLGGEDIVMYGGVPWEERAVGCDVFNSTSLYCCSPNFRVCAKRAFFFAAS